MTTDSPSFDARHTALLVMDYQPAIVDSLADHERLLDLASQAIAFARGHEIPIAFVRVAFAEADWAALSDRNKYLAPVAANRMMHHEAPETQIHDALDTQPQDIVVRKTRVSAFSTTDLGAQLHDRGITTIILAGIHTSGVVLSTVRDAADSDYQIYVLADATADPDPDVHQMLTTRILPLQAHVITVDDLPGLVQPH